MHSLAGLLPRQIEDLENSSSNNSGNINTTDTFNVSLPSGSGMIPLGNAPDGYLSSYSIEGVSSQDDVKLDLDGTGYIVGISNTQNFGTGIEYFPDDPSYEVLASDTLHLIYNNIQASQSITVSLNYQ